jgi:hypothetical protein
MEKKMENIENKNEISASFNAQLGVILEESASSLTQGHFGIGGEGRFKPRP